MAQDRTSGFDMLVQISEAELNTQIATLFLAGGVFPPSISVPFNSGGVIGTADFNFGVPVMDLDRPRPQIGITVPFSNSQIVITSPIPATLSPLSGTITIVDSVEMISVGTDQIATIDFTGGAVVTVAFDAASQAVLAPALAIAGLTLAQVENMMAAQVLAQLQTSIGRLDLTPPIPVVDDADPLTVFDIDVTTVNDTSSADRDCLTFGVRMSNETGGNINNVSSSFIPGGSNSLVMMSNFWLLAKVMRPRVASSLGAPLSAFDTPLHLNTGIPAPGGTGTLTNLDAYVEGNRIRVDGRATASGTGWSAVSRFTFFISLSLSGGSLVVTATTPSVNTDVDLEWWVWLISLGLGALFGGIVGIIIAAIVLAVIEAIAEGVVNSMVSSGISGSLGSIPSIPLGPIGGGLSIGSIILDDLELRSSIVHSVSVPIKNHGSTSSAGGFTIDLDTGNISSGVTFGTDLVWSPVAGFSTSGPARLTLTGTSYGGLSPVKIAGLPLSSTLIPAGLVPVTFDEAVPFFGHSEIVFGMRTSEGRYAKCRAWKDILEGGSVNFEWVTYDTAVPKLDVAGRWSVIERGPVREYITPDCSYCKTSSVRWCGAFEAWPKLMAFPVDLQWCLCGQILEEGKGQVSSPDGPLDYCLDGRRLYIETDMGQSVRCELCVSAIDARGQELFTCVRLNQPGVDTQCHKCEPKNRDYRIDTIAADREVMSWRPLLAHVEPEEVVKLRG